MEDIDGGLHPAVDGQSLDEDEDEDEYDDDDDDFISKAVYVKHAQLRWTMPMNNTHTHARTRAHQKHLTKEQ